MKTILSVLATAALVVMFAASTIAKTETVKGQLIDGTCYKMDKSNVGLDHKMPKGDTKDCATICAKAGHPMSLLTSDGKLYELTGGLAADNNAKIIPHLSHTVEVTGDVTEKDGKMMIAADTLKMVSK
jgi:hypothetical protein